MTAESPRMTALTPADAAKILAAAGNRRITEAMILADIEAGAPTNPRDPRNPDPRDPRNPCTINLVHYAAWLARQCSVAQLTREAAHGD